jgi:hypothetical protein
VRKKPECRNASLTSESARGKTQELKQELQQADKKDKGFVRKKTVLKKVVANMTMGNDSELQSNTLADTRSVGVIP